MLQILMLAWMIAIFLGIIVGTIDELDTSITKYIGLMKKKNIFGKVQCIVIMLIIFPYFIAHFICKYIKIAIFAIIDLGNK